MKLLFDQDLSPRLAKALAKLYPGSKHVREVGLHRGSDVAVWNYAIRKRFVIVSKDSDFQQRGFILGPPPKVVWIKRGNCASADVEWLLRRRHRDVVAFGRKKSGACLVLS